MQACSFTRTRRSSKRPDPSCEPSTRSSWACEEKGSLAAKRVAARPGLQQPPHEMAATQVPRRSPRLLDNTSLCRQVRVRDLRWSSQHETGRGPQQNCRENTQKVHPELTPVSRDIAHLLEANHEGRRLLHVHVNTCAAMHEASF